MCSLSMNVCQPESVCGVLRFEHVYGCDLVDVAPAAWLGPVLGRAGVGAVRGSA